MTKEDLIISAGKLCTPKTGVASEYTTKHEALSAKINQIMLNRDDLDSLIGSSNKEMMQDNHRNHARFFVSLFAAYDPEVLVETVLWVFRAYRSHGFQLSYWPAQLDTWVEVLKSHLSPEAYDEIYPFYHWMITNQPAFSLLSDKSLSESETTTPAH
ncbi:MAG: hypothetical protein HQL32_05950 [Planctomycetes bacterium]|nr:hypothetical protein [Planctomycetota bacterium]